MNIKRLSILLVSFIVMTNISAQTVLTITQPVVAAYSADNSLGAISVLPSMEKNDGNADYYFGLTIVPVTTTDGVDVAKTLPFSISREGNGVLVKGLSGSTTIYVYDQGGVLMRNIKTHSDNVSIDVSSFPAVSIIKINNDKAKATYKLIKQK